MPYARASTGCPPRLTPTLHPGVAVEFHLANTASTRVPTSGATPAVRAAGAWAPSDTPSAAATESEEKKRRRGPEGWARMSTITDSARPAKTLPRRRARRSGATS